AHPYAVRVARLAPGQDATVPVEPGEERLLELLDLHDGADGNGRGAHWEGAGLWGQGVRSPVRVSRSGPRFAPGVRAPGQPMRFSRHERLPFAPPIHPLVTPVQRFMASTCVPARRVIDLMHVCAACSSSSR